MLQNQAVKIVEQGNAQVVDVPLPELPHGYMLVKVTAVAINPTDWKHIEYADSIPCVGSTVGCDYAGVVEQVGEGGSKVFKKGDRVTGLINGSNGNRASDGAFATYAAAKIDLQFPIPSNMSDEQAATLGVATATVGQGLYQTLNLPMPTEPAKEPFPVLIYGGSTAMGVSGIQYAKLSGATVITTSSPHNFEYVKSLGADLVFDYHDPSAPEQIRAATGSKLLLGWDCQSSEDSARFVAACLDPSPAAGARIAHLSSSPLDEAVALINPHIGVYGTLSYTVTGEPWVLFGFKEAVPEDHEFARMFFELSQGLLAEGKVKPIRVIKNRGGEGLEGVLVGLQELKEGKVSGGKLVYTL